MSDVIAFLQGRLDIVRNGRIGNPSLYSFVVRGHSFPNALCARSTTANVDARVTSWIFMLKHQEIADPEQLKLHSRSLTQEVVVEIRESLADRIELISSVLQCSPVQGEMW